MISKERIRQLLSDPKEFIPILSIIDEKGKARLFNEPFSEQIEILDAIMNNRVVYIVKPRQIGCSTIVRAYNFWYGYTCQDPIRELVVAHETEATQKMHRLNEEYLKSLTRLDPYFQRTIKASNRNELWFDPDSDSGVMFRCLTAGGTGEGKSWSFQRGHFTEVGSWPADKAKALWGSLTSTMHEGEHYQLIAESTGHGPRTFWAKLVKDAQYPDSGVKIVFMPWFKHKKYFINPPTTFGEDLNDEEEDLKRIYGVTNGQLYWRRMKIAKIGQTEFRHNYPATIDDAFMDEAGTYFDTELLTKMKLEAQNKKPIYNKRGFRIYDAPVGAEIISHGNKLTRFDGTPLGNAGGSMRYVVSADSSSGIGQDYAAIQVFSEEFKQVAVYHSNRTKPEDLATIAAEVGMAYNKARIIAEGKGSQGGVTLYRLKQLGYPNLWKSPKGKDWDMDFVSKSMAYSHARHMLNTGGVELVDELTISELIRMEISTPESATSDADMISAPKNEHDDLADTFVMALWALKSITHQGAWSPQRTMAFERMMKRLPATSY